LVDAKQFGTDNAPEIAIKTEKDVNFCNDLAVFRTLITHLPTIDPATVCPIGRFFATMPPMPSPKFSSLALTAALCLAACGMPSHQTPAEHKQAAEAMRNPDKVYATVLQEATELQGKIVDGWFRGEDSRSLKSGYRDCSAATKARFACDYARMISENKEDMVNNWKSYIPYSKRADFARKWWSDQEHSTDFVKQNHWLQIVWLHEALIDSRPRPRRRTRYGGQIQRKRKQPSSQFQRDESVEISSTYSKMPIGPVLSTQAQQYFSVPTGAFEDS
jgi:hypothetical protein